MANKRNKKRQQRSRRPSSPGQQPTQAPDREASAAGTIAPLGATATAAAPIAPVSPAAAAGSRPPAAGASRYAGSISGPRRGTAAAASTGTIDIDERVPYFGRDLRRILLTAGAMVILIIGFSLILH